VPHEESLDSLALRARSGDRGAEERLFAELRVMFLGVAKHRVRAEEVEDVVQEALRIVLARHATRLPDGGILPWSFTVLRNVIGNAYQRRAREERYQPLDESLGLVTGGGGDPGEALDRSQTLRALARALSELAVRHPRCALLFRAILTSLEEGGGPHAVSSRARALVREELPEMSEASFHVALHRCRARLREHFRALDPGQPS
jgi:DNA-directed RNA polymerase specialized sigma24 family protein